MGVLARPAHPGLLAITLMETRQVTVDIAAAAGAFWTAPFAGTLLAVQGLINAIGGTTVFTDVDLDVKVGATSLLAAVIPIVQSSAIDKTALGLVAGAAANSFALSDRLDLDIDITGGSSPTGDGIGVILWVVPD